MTNVNNVADIVRDDITTIKGYHHNQKCDNTKKYTYKCLRRLANELSEGDEVLVRNCYGTGVVIVTEIDKDPDIDPDANYSLRWAFQRVKNETVDKLIEHEQKIVDSLDKKRKQAIRQQSLQALGINPEDTVGKLNYDPVD